MRSDDGFKKKLIYYILLDRLKIVKMYVVLISLIYILKLIFTAFLPSTEVSETLRSK